jgi:hypothetical protein
VKFFIFAMGTSLPIILAEKELLGHCLNASIGQALLEALRSGWQAVQNAKG